MEIREEAEMMHKLGTSALCGEQVVVNSLLETTGNHPNVIGFVGAVTVPKAGTETNLCLVTEYCQHGSLFDMLVVRQIEIRLGTLIRMARDIAAGILVCTPSSLPQALFNANTFNPHQALAP